MIFSKGNRKLPKTTAIFNLPSGKTCPNATAECKKWCYASKAEKMYPQVLPFREKNFVLTKKKNFKDLIIAEIQRLKDIEQIRLHESGDMYCQSYLNDWIAVSKVFPQITFYAYTKCYHLDFEARPNNFIVLLTDDNEKLQKYHHKFDGITRVDNKLILQKQGQQYFNCPMDCKICNYCYSKSGDFKRIAFPKH